MSVDMTSAERPAGQAIPSLDGIRAVAVSMVFLAHSGLEKWIPGGLGVTIFFVLSGYLITTLLRAECSAAGTVRFGAFYLRRWLRLIPPLFIVVIAAAVLSSMSAIRGTFTAGGLRAVLFYLGNYYVIFGNWQGIPQGLGVVWSLAVEEHFYLFYPPCVLLLQRLPGGAARALALAVPCAAVLGWRIWLSAHGGSEDYLTMATDTRIDAILVGCAMGWWHNPWLDPVPRRSLPRDSALAACCVLALLGTLVYRDEWFRVTWRFTLQSLAIAPLIYLAVARADQAPYRWLNTRPMAYIGTVSYTVYLSHHIIMNLVAGLWPQLGWLAATGVCVAATLAVAESMRRIVEEPCTRLRKRLHAGLRRAPAASQQQHETAYGAHQQTGGSPLQNG